MSTYAASVDSAASSVLLAEIQVGVLARSFLIALIVLTPLWILLRRRVLGRDTDTVVERDESDESEEPRVPRLEDVIAAVPAAAAAATAEGSATLEVPFEATIDGAGADRSTIDVLVRDALRRSGVVVAAEIDASDGRTLELRPAAVGREQRTHRERHE